MSRLSKDIQQAEMERDRAIRETRRLWEALDKLLTTLRPMHTSKFDGLDSADEFIKAKDNAADALEPKPQIENIPTDKQLFEEAKAENKRLREDIEELDSFIERIDDAGRALAEKDGNPYDRYTCWAEAAMDLSERIIVTESENKRMYGALEFYGNLRNYKSAFEPGCMGPRKRIPDVLRDAGRKANAVLKDPTLKELMTMNDDTKKTIAELLQEAGKLKVENERGKCRDT